MTDNAKGMPVQRFSEACDLCENELKRDPDGWLVRYDDHAAKVAELAEALANERARAAMALAALKAYDKNPVDAADNPASWGLLFNLCNAVAALASEETARGEW